MTNHTPTHPEIKEIPLTLGKVALVDASDYDVLVQFKWRAVKHRNTCYAVHSTPRVNGKRATVYMHTMLLGKGVDHIDGNGLRNTRDNLRLATNQENHFNMRPRVGYSSAFKGVAWHKDAKKWYARIQFNSKKMHLGYFKDEREAARAYDDAARELFGEFARLNFGSES